MLIVYPDDKYDSFVSLDEANDYIFKNSVFNEQWDTIADDKKEIYLRIATKRILSVIDKDYLGTNDECLINSCSLMAVRDLVFNISSGVNENTGLITKEKVDSLEVTYYHGKITGRANGLDKNPFFGVEDCLKEYGAIFGKPSILKVNRL